MNSKRQIISLLLLGLTALFAALAFSSVADAVFSKTASVFLVPAVWFLLLLTVFVLGTVLWQQTIHRTFGSALLLSSSLFFAPSVIHAGIVILGMIIVFIALIRIEREFSERTHISIYRGVTVGFAQIVFALALVISSQYYQHTNTLTWDELVPSFDLAEGTGAWFLRTAGQFSPSLATLQNRNLSVDSFLQEVKPVVMLENGNMVDRGINEALRQAEVLRSKSELSRLLGREVAGNESINEVLTEVLRKKMIAFVSGSEKRSSSAVPFLPFVLAILLFLTVYPFGSIIGTIALSMAALIFAGLIRSRVIEVKVVSAEREIIV